MNRVLLIKVINFISGPMIFHLKRRGILVTYWVLNHEKDFDDALKVSSFNMKKKP